MRKDLPEEWEPIGRAVAQMMPDLRCHEANEKKTKCDRRFLNVIYDRFKFRQRTARQENASCTAMKLRIFFSICLAFALPDFALAAHPALDRATQQLLQAINRGMVECLGRGNQTDCEEARRFEDQLDELGEQRKNDADSQYVMFCIARQFVYEEAAIARKAGVPLAEAEAVPTRPVGAPVPQEIRARIYDQVYGHRAFRNVTPQLVMDAVGTACLLGPSYTVTDSIARAKDAFGDEEVERWIAGEAPNRKFDALEPDSLQAQFLWSSYNLVMDRVLKDLGLLISVED
ncbi:hypothetical protein [Achromobacter dolens]|uniref:hypothetical protein n=1 Tax=Achromobacter dolens TaxID=1287738 RepID=UPI0013C2B402|nr:hypothetical protein [Achromobacter dolens]